MKDKGRRDYTLNPTSRGPTNRVQFITRMMRNLIAEPIYQRMKEDRDLAPVLIDDKAATVARLIEELSMRRPALVITTSHGQTGPLSDAKALGASLGFLLDQVKKPVTPVALLERWNPGGAIWYAHACCSAGSDNNTNFRGLLEKDTTADRIVRKVAELGSMVAPLPLGLLRAKQPLRAFVGHVEPTFDFSLSYPEHLIPTTASLQQALYNGLYQRKREPVGLAMRRWWNRYGELLGVFDRSHQKYESGQDEEATPELVWSRLAAQDVKTTVILGDPVVTLPQPYPVPTNLRDSRFVRSILRSG